MVGSTNSIEPPPADTHFRQTLESRELRFKPLIRRMLWDFALGCLLPHRQRRSFGEDEEVDATGGGEHNKAWLLAESGGCGADEPHSVHSSFRFSFCSDVEVESAVAVSNAGCTVLMVNLDNGFSTESKPGEQKWRRIESLERSISPVSHSLIRFTYSQITSATRNFSKGRVLGRGALSCVFRGRVGIVQRAVAIKCLNKEDKESSKAFCRELMIASSLHDTHIVPLLGFCIDAEDGLFLVYKFVSGGSLEQFLHEKKKRGVRGGPALPWLARYKVAIGIAEAIEYLHYGTERCVVHRDIKPSNILLSSRNIPKLCDFGLATWTPAPSVPFLCKTVKGTFGYLAPEYFQHGKVSDKTDVYAFGVVLLELITGRKPIESKRGPGEENLVSWAKPLLEQGSFGELLDSRMELTRSMNPTVGRMVKAAAVCLSNEPSRPEMGEIVTILRGSKSRKKALLQVNSSAVIESHSELRRTRSEMKSHFALAMLGVEFEEDDNLYSR